MLAALVLAACVPEVVRTWLVLPPTDRSGRRPFAPSAAFARHLLAPGAPPPKAGQELTGELGEPRAWAERTAGDDGALGGEVAWAYASVASPRARVVLAKLSGASRLFVNGAGYAGDLYAYGFGGVPVALREGANDVYVAGVRGSFRLELAPVDAPIVIGSWDHVVPDLVAGEREGQVLVAHLLWNASLAPQAVQWSLGEGRANDSVTIPPLCPRRIAVPVPASLPIEPPSVRAPLAFTTPSGVILSGIDVPVRGADEARRVGFTSEIDGSLQWYALLPNVPRSSDMQRIPLPIVTVLSLHGAGVDALDQARSYSHRAQFPIVCPTNRRRFGFDWQDWGRRDAYEALDDAIPRLKAVDGDWVGSRRIADGTQVATMEGPRALLTGHSMGGHGTWHLAANDPDTFFAIAPSAGWASFDSYGGRPAGALRELWHAADFPSRTEELIANLAPIPTYVLHGSADDNVPVSEGKAMVAALEKAGGQPQSHFEEGAGHWWDGERAAGVDCVDWPGIFELFRAPVRPDRAVTFDWIGADPGVDREHYWVDVEQTLRYGRPFRVTARRAPAESGLALETDNVRRIRVRRALPTGTVTLDGHRLPRELPCTYELTAQGWGPASPPEGLSKSPDRCGPFKRAFDRRFLLVYGTQGDDAEDRELFERARHDLEVWWYRANGTPELVSDVELLARYARETIGRNLILYGNADTNAAWSEIDARCPIVVRRGTLKVGEREWRGDDLGAVFVFPRRDDGIAVGAAFADTGSRGARLGYQLAPFVSGVGYPDYAAFSSEVLAQGDGGVLAAGWFDHRWRLDGRGHVRAEPEPDADEKR